MLDLGCNAVLAYQQDFDVEGDSGIVARAYGTACVIQRREQQQQQQQEDKANENLLARQVFAVSFSAAVLMACLIRASSAERIGRNTEASLCVTFRNELFVICVRRCRKCYLPPATTTHCLFNILG